MESQILRQPLSYSSVPYPTIQCWTVWENYSIVKSAYGH
jgi:hypothetical protein